MKALRILAFTIATLLPLAAGAAPSEAVPFITEGQAAFTRGDLEAAKQNFEMAYRIDPRNQTTITFLRLIKTKEAGQPKSADVERQLAGLIVPHLEFKDATLDSALEFMKKTAARLSDGKLAANFVVQLPADQVSTQTVTLNLSNVPFTEALRYIGEVCGLKFSYEKYAIVVKPIAASTATPVAK